MTTTADVIPRWTLTDKLRKAREHAGLEQTELASIIGVSRTTIVNYERGNVAPRKIVLRAWAMATGVAISWLEDNSDHLVGTLEDNYQDLTPEVIAAVRAALATVRNDESPRPGEDGGSDVVRHQGLEPRTR